MSQIEEFKLFKIGHWPKQPRGVGLVKLPRVGHLIQSRIVTDN